MQCSVGRTEQRLRHIVLEPGVADNCCEEAAHIVRDQQQVTHKLALVVIEPHVVAHIGLAVGQEEEVCVVCTLLTADPHHPYEDRVEVRDELELYVEDPYDGVEKLNHSRHVWAL